MVYVFVLHTHLGESKGWIEIDNTEMGEARMYLGATRMLKIISFPDPVDSLLETYVTPGVQ